MLEKKSNFLLLIHYSIYKDKYFRIGLSCNRKNCNNVYHGIVYLVLSRKRAVFILSENSSFYGGEQGI